MGDDIFPAIVGAIVAALLAAFKGYVDSKAQVAEGVREKRLSSYPELWRLTSLSSTWPRADVTFDDLERLHLALRRWYYESGGLYLSENARHRYGEVQELLARVLGGRDVRAGDRPPDQTYERIERTVSALRTALTEDLETRAQRNLVTRLELMRRHRAVAAENARRISAVDSATRSRRYRVEEWQAPERRDPASCQSTTQGLK